MTSRAPDLSQWLRAAYRAACSLPGLPALMVGLFTVAYFAVSSDLASLKPFRFDELTTYNIARSPTAGDVWRAWLESGDAVPPLVHLTTHFVGSALGLSHITARLPDMLGFWLMCVCVFLFLRRRVCPMLALVGMLLPLTVPEAYAYAYDTRGYGMLAGFSAVAVVCWDLADDTRWRRVALLGLPLALAAAIATHLYAVLVVVSLALAELARTIERRRVDWLLWLGVAAVGLMLLPVNPVIAKIRRLPELTRYTSRLRVIPSELLDLWPQLLSTSATYLGLLAIVCLGGEGNTGADHPLPAPTERRPPCPPALIAREGRTPAADWALAIGFVALPAIGWLFANLVTGILLVRYLIPTVIGFSLGIPLLCRMGIGRRPEMALLLAAWVAVAAAGSTVASEYALRTTFTTAHIAAGGGCFRLLKVWERLPADDLPIVVSEFYVFNQLHHYAPDALKPRLVFLVDREFGGLIEPMMPFYAKVFGEHMEGYDQFVSSHRSFYLYDCGSIGKLPLLDWLLGAGASVRDGGLVDTPDVQLRRELYRVSMPGGSTESETRR